MHPLEKHHHHPEYLNHIMMRFGHHLSVHQQQTFSTQFSGGMSSSCQGSRIQKKLSSVTAQQRQHYSSQLTSGIFPFKKPVVHISKSSLPLLQQEQEISTDNKNENKKKIVDSIQQDVTMKDDTTFSSELRSDGTRSITMTTLRNNNSSTLSNSTSKHEEELNHQQTT
ncbi:hypothetical protein INT45_002244 [Circinella minor]|uniref:Uncharacterized protein n=1 Tax=Circinella minor TaxID=1195481 RepID=A0A8H7VUH7_9FUNG|nr:hypothetical protein INT45_002244 [Circinella minor]